jgi:hypothetical protein
MKQRINITFDSELKKGVKIVMQLTGATFSGYLESLARKDLQKKQKEVKEYEINNTD